MKRENLGKSIHTALLPAEQLSLTYTRTEPIMFPFAVKSMLISKLDRAKTAVTSNLVRFLGRTGEHPAALSRPGHRKEL